MVDCRATGDFIDEGFVEQAKIPTWNLSQPILVYNVDGRAARHGRFYSWYGYHIGVPYLSCYEKYVHNDRMADSTARWHQSCMITVFIWPWQLIWHCALGANC